MTKFVPTLTANKKYNMKLVAVIDNKHTAYAYIDDDGDCMLVRNFDDPMRLPYVSATLATKVNPKSGRTYTVVIDASAGEKFGLPEVSIPESWRTGKVLEGEALCKAIKDIAEDALESVKYADGDWMSDCEDYVDRKLGGNGRPSRAFEEAWLDRAINSMEEACKPFGTTEQKDLEKIINQL